MTIDQRTPPTEVQQALADIYSGPGVDIWWSSPNTMFDGRSPRESWEDGQQRVLEVAQRIGDGNFA